MCLCPNGSYGYFSGGRIACGNGRGYSPPVPQSQCPAGNYQYGHYCVKSGHVVCPGSGGAISCPVGMQCASGNKCIPLDATDCGAGYSCGAGTICWTDPIGIPGLSAGTRRCLTPDVHRDLSRFVEEHRDKEYAEKRLRQIAKEIAAEQRRDQELQNALQQQISKIASMEDRFNTNVDSLLDSLAETDSTSELPGLDETPEAIMEKLGEDSVLERLDIANRPDTTMDDQQKITADVPEAKHGADATIDDSPSSAAKLFGGTGGIPPRQTPAPRNITEPSREEATAKTQLSPSLSPKTERPTAVQNWLAGRPVDPQTISEISRQKAEENRKRIEYEQRLGEIELETKRAQKEAYWSSAPDLSSVEKARRRLQAKPKRNDTFWTKCPMGAKTETNRWKRCFSIDNRKIGEPAHKVCDVFIECEKDSATGIVVKWGEKFDNCEEKTFTCF